jgi:flagellar biosynthesis protein FlhG
VAPDYVGFVPRDPQAQMAVRQQRSLVELYPGSPASRAFKDIARRLASDPAQHAQLHDTLPLR